MPGAVRARAGINTSEGDVARFLTAVERLVAGEPLVRYRRDPSTADFYPAGSRVLARAGSSAPSSHNTSVSLRSSPPARRPSARAVPAVLVPAMISRPALS